MYMCVWFCVRPRAAKCICACALSVHPRLEVAVCLSTHRTESKPRAHGYWHFRPTKWRESLMSSELEKPVAPCCNTKLLRLLLVGGDGGVALDQPAKNELRGPV